MMDIPSDIQEQIRHENRLARAHFCANHKAYNALFTRQFPTEARLQALQARKPELFDWSAEPPAEYVNATKTEDEEGTSADPAIGAPQLPEEGAIENQDIPTSEELPTVFELALDSLGTAQNAAPEPSTDPAVEKPSSEHSNPKTVSAPPRQTRSKRSSPFSSATSPNPPPPAKKPKPASFSNRRTSARLKKPPTPTYPPSKPGSKIRRGPYEALAWDPWSTIIYFCHYDQIRRRLAMMRGSSRLKYYPKLERDELDYDRLMMDCNKVKTSGSVWFINRDVGKRGYLERNLQRGKKERWRGRVKL